MPDPNNKNPSNLPGKYYVDDTCIDCDCCHRLAGSCLARFRGTSVSYVYQQPESPEEIALADEALDHCPTESIGRDGE